MEQNRGRARRSPDAVNRRSDSRPDSRSAENHGRSQTYRNGTGTPSPERIKRSGEQTKAAPRTDSPKTAGEPKGRVYSTAPERKSAPSAEKSRFVAGTSRKARDSAPKASRSLVEVRKQERALREAEKERKWQEDIVRVRGGVDKIMLAIILVLVCLGSIMVFSASYPIAVAEGKDSLYYASRQITFVLIGSVAMLIASLIPYKIYKNWAPFVAYGGSLLLLVAVLFIGQSEGEAKRWIGLGPITIQPSELMKVSLVLILAWYIEKFKPKIDARIDRWQTIKYNVVGPGIFVGAACVLILLEKHLSGTIITGVVALAVMFVGGCHFGWTALIFGSAGILAGTVFLLTNPYALKRITTFTDENADKLDELYQTTQGIYAIGSGGLFGLGFGQSRQKYSYVSAAHTDFIFSIWCEEMGFIGGMLLVALFIAFVWRGYVIASRAPDTFSMLTAFGITTHVGLQAFLNMCVASDIIPNTGISLPFFSYGGSSLVVLLAEMGVLLSISRQYYRKKDDLEREKLLREMEF